MSAENERLWIASKWHSFGGDSYHSELILSEEAFAMECLEKGWTIQVVEVIETLEPASNS